MASLINLYNIWRLALSPGAEVRIHRHFRRYPDVRLSQVMDASRAPAGLPGDLSPLELTAAFSLMLARTPLAGLIQQLDSLASSTGRASSPLICLSSCSRPGRASPTKTCGSKRPACCVSGTCLLNAREIGAGWAD